jgi:hypothetical protein
MKLFITTAVRTSKPTSILMTYFKNCGVLPAFPHTSSWRGAQLINPFTLPLIMAYLRTKVTCFFPILIFIFWPGIYRSGAENDIYEED